jgi:predicted transcriptional regulator
MKKLVVSYKTATQVFDDFKKAAKSVQKKSFQGEPQYEVSLDNKADFNKFVRNIPVLAAILTSNPRSVYELAKIIDVDVSNLNKIIDFFEEIGVVKIKTQMVAGRKVKKPKVEYNEVTFRLAA